MPASYTILIADDETDIHDTLRRLFAAEPYRLVFAENGAEALRLAAEVFPDVVLLDVMMPYLDGLEVCRRLRADPRLGAVPIVLITALADHATRLAGLEAGADDFFSKPFERAELLARVRTILRFNHYRQLYEDHIQLEAERQQTLHALQVHQVELEMQNEELRRTQAELEAARARYFNLYDLAPVGYVTLSEQGLILEANLAAAELPGVERGALAKQPLTRFILPEDQDIYYRQRKRLFETGRPQVCELRLVKANGAAVWVQLEATLARDPAGVPLSRVVISNLTARKQAETAVRELSAMLEQRVADRTRDLSTLYAIATITSQSLPLRAMLEQALAIVLETMDGHSGAINLLDEANHCLRLCAQVKMPAEVLADISVIPLGQGLSSWIMEHDTPLVVPDISQDPRRISTFQTEVLWQARTYVGVPMHAQGRGLGVLSLLRPADHPFNSEAVALLSTIADQMAVAIESAQLRQQAEQMAVMEERQRLARELHDSLTQALYSLTLLAETGYRQLAAGDQAQAQARLAIIRETAQQALKEMRLLVFELRPTALESEGLMGALQQRLEAVEQRAGIETRLQVEGLDSLQALGRQAPRLEESLYRIALEALNNAYRHAAAPRITVRLEMNARQVEVEITDNGRGFNPGAPGDRGGQGLAIMRERAEKLGGEFRLTSTPGQGTQVQARFEHTRINQTDQETL